MEQIFSVVGQYAFPIVACVVMGWYVKYTQDNYRNDIKTLNDNHSKEMDNIKDALDNNTLALQKLIDIIDYIKGGIK